MANALGAHNDVIQIYSNSWGPSDAGTTVYVLGDMTRQVIELATKEVNGLELL